jgi:penicillin-binding protein 2
MQPTLVREVLDGEGNVVQVDLYEDDQGNLVPVVVGRDDNPPYNPDKFVRTLSPFTPDERWDLTRDPIIPEFGPTTIKGCAPIEGSGKTIDPSVFEKVQEGMRLAVTEGTLSNDLNVGFYRLENSGIRSAGKTGTAEYCDQFSIAKRGGQLCDFGDWDRHAWTIAYAPYEDPEIAVVAFVYNGGEGSSIAGPIVRQVLEAYFLLKAGR